MNNQITAHDGLKSHSGLNFSPFNRRLGEQIGLLAFAAALVLGPAAGAQTARIRVLYEFDVLHGANPRADLTPGPDGDFYGTTDRGGSSGDGTVFKWTTKGMFTSLVSFNGTNGRYPRAGLTLGSDGNFYGTTYLGGSSDHGTLFKVTPNGVLTRLVSFSGYNGAIPFGRLTLASDGSFYGTTEQGGTSGNGFGTVFQVTTNGVLHTLVLFDYNARGAYPGSGLTLGVDGNFYGTTEGGADNNGTVFKLATNGALTTLVSFHGTNGNIPFAGLTLGRDGNFYGTTCYGGPDDELAIGRDGSSGSSPQGTVFKVTTNGVLITLASFNGLNGASPYAGLTLGRDGAFYGTTTGGGNRHFGTVFKVTTNGVLTTLVSFGGTNGANPYAGLTRGGDGDFYGTTADGGSHGYGTLFKLCMNHTPHAAARLAPLLDILPNETNQFILSPNGSDATVVLDGSQSSDPDSDPLQLAWFADGQANALASGTFATNEFAVGSHALTLAVDDGCDTETAQVSFEVITLATAVGQLILLVDETDVEDRGKQPLLAILSAAMSSFDRGGITSGLKQLSAFQNKIRSQVAPLNPTLANQLTAASDKIIDVVGR